jgi:hypothetical protein
MTGAVFMLPDYEALYLRDEANSLSIGLTPLEPINPIKVGVIDYASVGVQVSCGGFMGDEDLKMFHFAATVADGITWLQEHGCGQIVNITINTTL